MSSSQCCPTLGIFAVSGGCCNSQKNKKSNKSTYYFYYNSVLTGQSDTNQPGTDIPVEIRQYSPPDSTILADETIVFLSGQLSIDNSAGHTYINTIFLVPFPGNPWTQTYDTNIPDIIPWIWVIGHVQSKLEPLANPTMMGFRLLTSEYVCDSPQAFQLHCAFNTTNRHFTHPPSPFPRSCVTLVGHIAYCFTDGTYGIRVEHITLNLSRQSGPVVRDDGNGPATPSGSPSKKWKFKSSLQPVPSPNFVLSTPSNTVTIPKSAQVTLPPQTSQQVTNQPESNAMVIDGGPVAPDQTTEFPVLSFNGWSSDQPIPPSYNDLLPISTLTLPLQQSVVSQPPIPPFPQPSISLLHTPRQSGPIPTTTQPFDPSSYGGVHFSTGAPPQLPMVSWFVADNHSFRSFM
ncbi:hypothetical protein FRB93_002743 [Tulasnella sp. JGI-2019a]|nr:hypothetical protein FRB93_002743 [Tulasnella sp. JGI-2019a]